MLARDGWRGDRQLTDFILYLGSERHHRVFQCKYFRQTPGPLYALRGRAVPVNDIVPITNSLTQSLSSFRKFDIESALVHLPGFFEAVPIVCEYVAPKFGIDLPKAIKDIAQFDLSLLKMAGFTHKVF